MTCVKANLFPEKRGRPSPDAISTALKNNAMKVDLLSCRYAGTPIRMHTRSLDIGLWGTGKVKPVNS